LIGGVECVGGFWFILPKNHCTKNFAQKPLYLFYGSYVYLNAV
jgi:hypothetical protein